MSFVNKSNGREYINKSNTNTNKSQNMSYRNTLTNSQYSNSSNGDSYPFDDKSQHSINSHLNLSENHGVSQPNTVPRDANYKNSNPRIRPYHQNKNYNDKYSGYFNQRTSSPEDIAIPEIEHLRQFIKDQADRFKLELHRHELQMSNSTSPSNHQYSEHSNNRFNKSYGSLGRTPNGLVGSHSLGSIASSSSNVTTLITSSVPPTCTDNNNRHQDARIGLNNFVVVKNNANGYNYNKHSSQNSGKPSPGLTRNLSHDDSFSKSPSVTNNKNRTDSPSNNTDKIVNNKPQFPSPTGSTGGRQDQKKGSGRGSYTFASGANPASHQMNQNNSETALSVANEARKTDQQCRPTMSSVVRNGIQNVRVQNPRNVPTASKSPATKMEGDIDTGTSLRTVDNSTDKCARHNSHSDSTTDSQEVPQSAADTPTAHEQFFTPATSGSPGSTRSSPENAILSSQYPRGTRKAIINRNTNAE